MMHKTVGLTDRLYWNPWGLTLGTSFTLVLFILAEVFPTFPGDEWVLLKFQGYQTGWLTEAALGVTHLGSTWVAASLAGTVIIGLLLLRHRVDALIIFLGVILIGTGNALKLVVGRPRPEYLLVDSVPATLSFPSGHALFAVIFGGFLIFLAGKLVQPRLVRGGVAGVPGLPLAQRRGGGILVWLSSITGTGLVAKPSGK
jgi:membrane-associated phospholipid phosphatase